MRSSIDNPLATPTGYEKSLIEDAAQELEALHAKGGFKTSFADAVWRADFPAFRPDTPASQEAFILAINNGEVALKKIGASLADYAAGSAVSVMDYGASKPSFFYLSGKEFARKYKAAGSALTETMRATGHLDQALQYGKYRLVRFICEIINPGRDIQAERNRGAYFASLYPPYSGQENLEIADFADTPSLIGVFVAASQFATAIKAQQMKVDAANESDILQMRAQDRQDLVDSLSIAEPPSDLMYRRYSPAHLAN